MAPRRIAYFVSGHGFGHATRASAVMQSLRRVDADVELTVFGTTPEWLFAESVGRIAYRAVDTDVGLVQRSPLEEDIPATLERLAGMLPFADRQLDLLAAELQGQDLVVCDISPLGLAAAERAGIPSMLVENFTWGWIYRGYVGAHPRLEGYINLLDDLVRRADRHVQTTPVCDPQGAAERVAPVSRHLRASPRELRRSLGLTPETALVLISMGGIPTELPALERLKTYPGVVFAVPAAAPRPHRDGAVLWVPCGRSGYYHPDLVNASDAVVTKAGYSTIVEAWQGGVPVACVTRERFREAAVLAEFLAAHLPSLILTPREWACGAWVERVPELLRLGPAHPGRPNGADQVARLIHRPDVRR